MNKKRVKKRLRLLEEVEKNTKINQECLAGKLNMGTGTVNCYINCLTNKGFIKMERIGQWEWKYTLTKEGEKEKARLTRKYIKNSMELYRKTRKKAKNLLSKLKQNNHSSVYITGDDESDLREICFLTALELDMDVVNSEEVTDNKELPELKVKGKKISLATNS